MRALSPRQAANSTLTSPFRTHPALHPSGNVIPFPGAAAEQAFSALEAEVRLQRRPSALSLFAVTETARVIGHDAALWFGADWRGQMRLEATSGLQNLPRRLFNVASLEELLLTRSSLDRPLSFLATGNCHALWLPLSVAEGALPGGLLLLRRKAWRLQELTAGVRLAGIYAAAFRAISPASPVALPIRRLLALRDWWLRLRPKAGHGRSA
jgi:hypothetical protein